MFIVSCKSCYCGEINEWIKDTRRIQDMQCMVVHYIVSSLQWKSDQNRMIQQGTKVIEALSQAVSLSSSADTSLPGRGCVQRGYEMLEGRFDSTHGGFGREPKFPQPGINQQCTCSHYDIFFLCVFLQQS